MSIPTILVWVSTYLKRDSKLPEWWEEFQPLPNFADGCRRDAQAKHLACQQAAAFHLPADQKAVHSTWLTPPSLTELRRKEHLGPKDPWLNHDFQEVQKEETVMLAVVLKQCAIQARPLQTYFVEQSKSSTGTLLWS